MDGPVSSKLRVSLAASGKVSLPGWVCLGSSIIDLELSEIGKKCGRWGGQAVEAKP